MLLNSNIKDMNIKLDEVQERIDLLHSRTVVQTKSVVEKIQLMVVDSMTNLSHFPILIVRPD